MRFDAMQHLDRCPLRWNPVVPSARHMDSRIKLEYAIGKGVAAAKIIKEPAVDLSLTQSLLNLADTRIDSCGHSEGHLIVALPSRQ